MPSLDPLNIPTEYELAYDNSTLDEKRMLQCADDFTAFRDCLVWNIPLEDGENGNETRRSLGI
jgi:hypothetical protein